MRKEDVKEVLLQVSGTTARLSVACYPTTPRKARGRAGLVHRQGRRRQSLVDLSVQILTESRNPLHVNLLVAMLQQRFGRLTDRDTLSSALAKKARQGILLRQSAPATFTLIDSKEDNHDKA